MASINGIELKGIKEFKGHEQEDLVQGNIYYKNKKVGWYSQDSYGGCDIIELDRSLSTEIKNEINSILDNYESDSLFLDYSKLMDDYYNRNYTTHKFKGGEWLFMELLELQDQEDLYKKYSKKWGIGAIGICYKTPFERNIVGSRFGKERLKDKINNSTDIKLSYIYTSLDDFNKKVGNN